VHSTPVDRVYEHGFYPLQGGFKATVSDDFEVFDQWIEIVPTDQVAAVEVKYDPKTGRPDLTPPDGRDRHRLRPQRGRIDSHDGFLIDRTTADSCLERALGEALFGASREGEAFLTMDARSARICTVYR
jgi:hypothetical protein